MTIRDQVQKLVGMPDFLRVMTTALNAMKREIIEACQEVLTAREPYLACVTFIGNTIEDASNADEVPMRDIVKLRPTAFGAEVFLYPGDEETFHIPALQRPVGHITYFVSGHPNIVITELKLNGNHQASSMSGHKFGRMGGAVKPGDGITITLKFRTNSETL